MTRRSWAAVLFVLLAVASARAYALTPVNLTVEYQSAPLAIDDREPRFFWQMTDERRGAAMHSFQLRLRDGRGQVWDSGRKDGDGSEAIPYFGPPLAGRTRYFWTVEVWDGEGKATKSTEASFVTGVLRPEDWRANWIWKDAQVTPNQYAYFHKSFDLPAAPVEAIALVSAHNFYLLFVNGKQVSGYSNPATSNPYAQKYYLAYDLTPFLQAGRNDVSAVCQYKGAGGQNYIDGVPGFLFEAKIELGDGEPVWVATGPDWKTLADTAWDPAAPYTNSRRHTLTEWIDLRKPDVAATSVAAGWKDATVVDPKYKMRSQYLAESKLQGLITAKKMWRTWAGTYVFDFGTEYAGSERVRVSGRPGDEITVRYSDRTFARRVAKSTGNQATKNNLDKFWLTGRPDEILQPVFGYRGFRFLEVSGLRQPPALTDVQAAYIRTALPRTATFACSNPLFNQIYEISMHTLEQGQIGQMIDCVHREQSQWHADAEMQSEAILLNFGGGYQLIRKALLDLAAGQYPDGRLPSNYPAQKDVVYYIPEWDMHYLPMLTKAWRYSGDDRLVAEVWPTVEKLIAFYLGQVDDTGLIVKSDAWHISDWPPDYQRIDGSGKYLTVENLLFSHTLRLAAALANMQGKTHEAKKWDEAGIRMAGAINERLYDAAAGAYLDSSGSKSKHQGVAGLALFVGAVPKPEYQKVMAFVTAPEKISASVYLSYFMLDALYQQGRSDYVYQLLNRDDMPGWGYMIKKGDGTTWENWPIPSSKAHPFNAYPAAMFIKYIVGIDLTGGDFVLRPHLDGLDWARASVQTPAGLVKADWKKEGTAWLLDLEAPAGREGSISLPGKIKSITETGNPVYPLNAQGKGCLNLSTGSAIDQLGALLLSEDNAQCLADYGNGVLLSVKSGHYNFRIEY